MAELALEKLDQQLNCSICLGVYFDPKVLQCLHVYCKNCLIKLVVRDQEGQLQLNCPTCRRVTVIPENGISGLQSAFHIDQLIEIRDSFETFKGLSAEPSEGASTSSIEKTTLKCFEHIDKEVELYCETCEMVICFKCAIKGGKHHSHDYNALDKAFVKYQGEIASSLEPIEKHLKTINSALEQLDSRCDEISKQQTHIEGKIHKTFQQLHELIDVRRTELISKLQQLIQDKIKGLEAQRDYIQTTQVQLTSCLDFMRETIRKGYQGEILHMKNTIVRQVRELTSHCQSDSLKPNTKADVAFSASSADIHALCENYGKVTLAPDPSKCYIINGVVMKVARAGKKTTAFLQAVNSLDEPCEGPIDCLDSELVSEINGTVMEVSTERKGEKQYGVNFQPIIKGRHQLHIRVDGSHIRGSPFTLAVTAPIERLGTPIQTIHIKSPVGVAINGHHREIILTSGAANTVSVLNIQGELLHSFGTSGSEEGQFDLPSFVTVDNLGNILVADANNHRIQKFTAGGHFLKAVGTKGKKSLQFTNPFGITFNRSNCKICVVDSKNRIQVLNSDLTYSSMHGKSGSGGGQFTDPVGIACDDKTGKIYVTDTSNHRVQVFTAEGGFLRMFGKQGQGRGYLSHPTGIAVDSTSGRIYVSERGNHRVSVFTCEGQFLISFGKEGKEPGEFKSPYSLVVDDSGVVYVCDTGNDRVQVF